MWEDGSWLAVTLLLLTLDWVFPLGTQPHGEKELWTWGLQALLESRPPRPCDGSVCFPDCQDWDIGRV